MHLDHTQGKSGLTEVEMLSWIYGSSDAINFRCSSSLAASSVALSNGSGAKHADVCTFAI